MRINISLQTETPDKPNRLAKAAGLSRSAYLSWLITRQQAPKFNDERHGNF